MLGDWIWWFRSTPPHGGRLVLTVAHLDHMPVSIHAPARRATTVISADMGYDWFRSTPPHGGRLVLTVAHLDHMPVSIHAPARRATCADRGPSRPHASFDPRPRTEGDVVAGIFAGLFSVSIHAPARRATSNPRRAGRRSGVSIHAPARRATSRPTMHDAPSQFRSTPPHGGRPWKPRSSPQWARFDPRPRTEGDDLQRRG